MKFSIGKPKATKQADTPVTAGSGEMSISPKKNKPVKWTAPTAKSSNKKKTKGFKVPRKGRFVLSIGDEGAILTYVKQGGVHGRWFASDTKEENITVFTRALATDEKAPLLVVLDTMDQTYTQQTLPPVSKMSLNGLLKRRIQREFGKTRLSGSYLLNRTESNEWNFMLYAIEEREELLEWFKWVATLRNCPLGIRILPLENRQLSLVLYDIYRADAGNDVAQECEWQFLVTHNKISGFRQVISRHGKMVFTRLGQPLEGGADVQAGMIEQEVASTVEYLKRIGLRNIKDLHLCIIASEDIVHLLDAQKMGVGSNELISPFTAAEKLGWRDVAKEDDRFADILLGVFALTNKKSVAKLWTPALSRLNKVHKLIPSIRIISLLGVLGLLAYLGSSGLLWWEQSDKITQLEVQRKQSTAEIIQLKSAVDMPPDELEKILDLFDLYKIIKEKELDPHGFLRDLSEAFANMPRDMRVQSIAWSEGKSSTTTDAAAVTTSAANVAPEPTPTGTPVEVHGALHINILVPSAIKSEALAERAKSVIAKIQPYLKHYTLTLSDIPGTKSANDSIDIDLSQPLKEESQALQIITLKAAFTGTEYIQPVRFDEAEQ